ncbi:hypothetical protein FSP39_004397 [Pinctada imbricata]|uniref:NPH3 domain-containing protein n=1 Tax=Pinctada imbricata TaxID=66713 RepID=A0AA88XYT5_PINIB|nr:hypothetical protein FSP39_004397 [Pinctada imbricata]
MSEMVRKGVLTAETYRLLATVIPKDARSNHDQMYNILEYVLTAEKEKLTPEHRQELIGTINFTLLNEETLQRAQEAALVPPDCLAKGALALCKRLRSELETAKNTILRQEEEVKRLQHQNKRGKRATPILTSAHAMPSLGLRDSSFSSSSGREPELEFMEPTKDYSVNDSHNNSTSDVLTAVRNKLSAGTSNPATSSPYNTFRPLQGPEQDFSFEEDMDYKYDRHFKSSENTRPKNRQLGYSGYRPTYSSYSLRY